MDIAGSSATHCRVHGATRNAPNRADARGRFRTIVDDLGRRSARFGAFRVAPCTYQLSSLTFANHVSLEGATSWHFRASSVSMRIVMLFFTERLIHGAPA